MLWEGYSFKGPAGTSFDIDDVAQQRFALEMAAAGVPLAWVETVSLNNPGPVILVAAADSASRDINAADLVCDGTADNVEIQYAIDNMPSRGGDIVLAPGSYNLAAGLLITANKRIVIHGAGALLNVPASTTGLMISQGATGGNKRGTFVYDLRIDGGGLANTIGVNFEDTNWSGLIGVQIENCDRGILMHANASNQFVEGITLEDVIIRTPGVYGIELRRTSGTNSFGQHRWSGVSINIQGSPTSAIGWLVPNLCSMYRSRLEVGVWIASSQTGVSIDGDMDNAALDLFVEGSTGSTGNLAVLIGANATISNLLWHFSTWGTVNNKITNASNKDFSYRSAEAQWNAAVAGSLFGIRRHGDTNNRVQFETPAAGGKIQLGPGNAVVDVNAYRSAANILASDDKVDPASLNLQVKAGTPVDGDIVGGAADGDIVVDSTGNKIWVRIGGTWKGVVVA